MHAFLSQLELLVQRFFKKNYIATVPNEVYIHAQHPSAIASSVKVPNKTFDTAIICTQTLWHKRALAFLASVLCFVLIVFSILLVASVWHLWFCIETAVEVRVHAVHSVQQGSDVSPHALSRLFLHGSILLMWCPHYSKWFLLSFISAISCSKVNKLLIYTGGNIDSLNRWGENRKWFFLLSIFRLHCYAVYSI